MILAHLNFPATGLERMELLRKAGELRDFDQLSENEKIAYVRGMDVGYYQGKREQARQTMDNFALTVIGFKP